MARVYLTPQAQKDLKKIFPKDKSRIKRKLTSLMEKPTLGKKLSGQLKGFYSLKIWPYRAIYLVDTKKEVWVVHISHRQGVHK